MAKQPAAETRDHMARITVTDEVWGEFREASRVRGISVTRYLAQLVSKEVTNLRAGAAKAETLTARHAASALADARSLRDDLEEITRRLEVLTDHPGVLARELAQRPEPPPAAPTAPPPPRLDVTRTPTPEELEEWKRKAAEQGPDWFRRRASEGPGVPDWEP